MQHNTSRNSGSARGKPLASSLSCVPQALVWLACPLRQPAAATSSGGGGSGWVWRGGTGGVPAPPPPTSSPEGAGAFGGGLCASADLWVVLRNAFGSPKCP